MSYIIDKLAGNCTVGPISGSYFGTIKDPTYKNISGNYVLQLDTPSQLFQLKGGNFIYVGTVSPLINSIIIGWDFYQFPQCYVLRQYTMESDKRRTQNACTNCIKQQVHVVLNVNVFLQLLA